MRNQNSRYVVVKRQHLDELEETVCRYMKIGFVPQGGVTFVIQNGYMQAMMKVRRSSTDDFLPGKMEMGDIEIPNQLIN